jgi:hypothetical protein
MCQLQWQRIYSCLILTIRENFKIWILLKEIIGQILPKMEDIHLFIFNILFIFSSSIFIDDISKDYLFYLILRVILSLASGEKPL